MLESVFWIQILRQVQRAIRIAPRRRDALLDYAAAWAEFQAPIDKLNDLKRDISEKYDEARNLVAPDSNQSGEGAVKGGKMQFGPENQLFCLRRKPAGQ